MTERGIKIREAFRKKYGVDHPSQLPSTKEKIKEKRKMGAYDNVVKKMKSTLKERYGTENYVNVEKAKQTKTERYGDPTYNNREKMIDTNISKYGMKVSTNTLKSVIERNENKEIGFGSDKFKEYSEKAKAVFDKVGLNNFDDFLFERALLATGNYLLKKGSNYSFLIDNDRVISWKRLLRDNNDKHKVLKSLFDNINVSTLIQDLEKIIT
jgi:ribosomal protein L28